MFQGCLKGDWRVFQESFQWVSRIFERRSKGISWKFQRGFKDISRKFQGRSKKAYWVLQGSFNGVLNKIKGCFNGVLSGVQNSDWKKFNGSLREVLKLLQDFFNEVFRVFQCPRKIEWCSEKSLKEIKGGSKDVLKGLGH